MFYGPFEHPGDGSRNTSRGHLIFEHAERNSDTEAVYCKKIEEVKSQSHRQSVIQSSLTHLLPVTKAGFFGFRHVVFCPTNLDPEMCLNLNSWTGLLLITEYRSNVWTQLVYKKVRFFFYLRRSNQLSFISFFQSSSFKTGITPTCCCSEVSPGARIFVYSL